MLGAGLPPPGIGQMHAMGAGPIPGLSVMMGPPGVMGHGVNVGGNIGVGPGPGPGPGVNAGGGTGRAMNGANVTGVDLLRGGVDGRGLNGGSGLPIVQEFSDETRNLSKSVREGGPQTNLRSEDNTDSESASRVAEGLMQAQRDGELGTASDVTLDKTSFRAVLQRMLTDRKLFETVYKNYVDAQEQR